MKLVGVDVGGTFTDIVYADTERDAAFVHKVPTTPADPALGVLDGIRELCARHGVDPASIDHVFHGTTIATNAVLEGKGARTGMITTRGYRDVIHVARHQRPQHYSIMQEMPWQNRPLVRRRHRKVVSERLTPPRGEVLVPLAEGEVRAAARELRAEGVEAIAVCFLFSYLDPRHEERARRIVLEEFPDAFVTTSASLSPQFREFERFTTASMNAFIGPRVRSYVIHLAEGLKGAGLGAELHIMASNGGVATAGMVSERPVLTLLSGPAAGVLGGAWAGALSERSRLITFDVGGTSADIGIVVDGRYSEATARDTWIAGYPVLVPMIDIHTIGAGGGSIAWIDQGGAFRVGPQSAGALPGPAAYGRGGTQPTVTDANLVLGRLDGESFLGGQMQLDVEAARRAIADLARRLGIDELDAAEGVLTILNSNMANAIRSRTIQKGIDPRQFSLVAFGGAGPLHGAEVAALLSIPEVIVPPHPGITSAVGLLTTDLKYDSIRTEFQVQGELDVPRLDRDFRELEDGLARRFGEDGLAADQVAYARSADLRYVGQGYELRVAVPAGPLDEARIATAFEAFHRQHEAEYGHSFRQSPIEIVNIRVGGIGRMPKIGRPAVTRGHSVEEARTRRGRCVFRVAGKLEAFDTAFYQRRLLPFDTPIHGPAVILQTDSTTVVPPGWQARAESSGNLILTSGGKA
jgi:N-methylhydantoinase A/oxoprolinase/acetone carboxylase beta subunit